MNIQKTMQDAVLDYQSGNFRSARNLCRKILENLPNEAAVLNLYGLVSCQLGEHGEAVRAISKAIRIKPDSSDFINNLGTVYIDLCQFDKAIQSFSRAIELKPHSASAMENLGDVYLKQGNRDMAINQYRCVLELQPDKISVCCKVANIMRSQGQLNAAIEVYRKTLQFRPECVEIIYLLGGTLEEQGNIKGSVDCYQRALKISPDIPDINTSLARCLLVLGCPHDALKYCDKALALSPGNTGAISIKAVILHRLGETEKAHDCLLPFLGQNTENIDIELAFAEIAGYLGRGEDAIGMLECRLGKSANLPDSRRSHIHFTLGGLYDAAGKYSVAFDHFMQGNELKVVEEGPYLYPNASSMVKYFNRACLDRLPRSGSDSDVPIFVVGMPRSGTTLVEQILSSHPGVYGAGELQLMGEQIFPGFLNALGNNQQLPGCLSEIKKETLNYLAGNYLGHIAELSGDGIDRVIDKMPGNYVYLWLIELLFPKARVIHCVRDPIDTCLSAYFQNFADSNLFTFRLNSLAKYYNIYKEIMEHWKDVLTIKMIDVEYEDIVWDTEGVSRKMVEFCGLEWDDRCLHFYQTRRFVGTASHEQVRKPIYKNSIGRWKNYEQQLQPLIKKLRIE